MLAFSDANHRLFPTGALTAPTLPNLRLAVDVDGIDLVDFDAEQTLYRRLDFRLGRIG